MFQDEARFGRLSNPRRCWAPAPIRPLVGLALVREYAYAYAAVTPADGVLDWMVAPKMNTLHMNGFLRHVSSKHPDEFVVMVLDGAPSHRALALRVPENMALLRLPPYSPELNPPKGFGTRYARKNSPIVSSTLPALQSHKRFGDSNGLRCLLKPLFR